MAGRSTVRLDAINKTRTRIERKMVDPRYSYARDVMEKRLRELDLSEKYHKVSAQVDVLIRKSTPKE